MCNLFIRVFFFTFGILLVVVVSQHVVAEPNCSSQNLVDQACQFFASHKSEKRIILSDGTWYNNPAYSAWGSRQRVTINTWPSGRTMTQTATLNDSANPNVFYQNSSFELIFDTGFGPPPIDPLRKQRVDQLFRDAKKAMIQAITKGRSDTQLSPEELSAIARIQTTTLLHGDAVNEPACHGVPFQAFYSPPAHTITLCPQDYTAPDSAIAAVIGHEIGHGLDPCNFVASSVYCVDAKKEDSKDPVFENGHSSCITRNKVSFYDTPVNQSEFQKYIQSGALKQVAPSCESEQYPFKSMYQCMVNAGFDEITSSDVREIQNFMSRRWGGGNRNEGIDTLLNKAPQCLVNAQNSFGLFGALTKLSNMGEVMSDIWGSIAGAAHIKSNPKPKTEAERYAPIATFGHALCDEGREKARLAQEKAQGYSSKPHPATVRRIEEIFLQNPSFVESLGCTYIKRPGNGCIEGKGSDVLTPKTQPHKSRPTPRKDVI